ncbi:hypothetical protein VNO77_13470 [Canavalia gladiata]|uniref:Uncharacterized protein n=1 Tax=Canavalia gladiata TaxID=3824 RepID=A0AAN9M2N8_CANGL
MVASSDVRLRNMRSFASPKISPHCNCSVSAPCVIQFLPLLGKACVRMLMIEMCDVNESDCGCLCVFVPLEERTRKRKVNHDFRFEVEMHVSYANQAFGSSQKKGRDQNKVEDKNIRYWGYEKLQNLNMDLGFSDKPFNHNSLSTLRRKDKKGKTSILCGKEQNEQNKTLLDDSI